MAWVIYYATLLLLFAVSTTYAATHPLDSVSAVMRSFAGGLTMLSALGQALAKVNFRLYLVTQQVWLFFNKDTTALWRFGLRLDGLTSDNPLEDAISTIKSDLQVWNPRIDSCNERQARVMLDRTLHLTLTYEPALFSGDGQNHLLIRSDELEVPYGSAKKKLDSCIVPLLGKLSRKLSSESSSTMLEVSFEKRNPFFAFYVAHLKPEQVSQFNLVFHPSRLSMNANDKVIVTRNLITISADSPESFGTLAKAFLLLSENAATMNAL